MGHTVKSKSTFILTITALAFLSLGTAHAEKSSEPPPSIPVNTGGEDLSEMNGIHFYDYADFPLKWKLVTVRFRTDSGEQRFTYANDIAYDTLSKGITDYPDGAVFAKIGIMTAEDPAFISSRVPSEGRRVQFMVRNKSQYAATNGWGYAVFRPSGARLSLEPVTKQAEACDACHQVVKNKGYVFSEPADFSMGIVGNRDIQNPPRVPTVMTFTNVSPSDLPSELAHMLPPGVDTIHSLDGPIRDHVFQGTLDEMRPALIREAVQTGHPAMILSRSKDIFSLVTPIPSGDRTSDSQKPTADSVGPACPAGKKKYMIFTRMFPVAKPAEPFLNIPQAASLDSKIRRESFCEE